MTEVEKRIYNCWLATTRSRCNKPFKLRKTWDGFEEKTDYRSIKKVASILNRYDNINMNDWFESPYNVYPDSIVEYDLKFYTLAKAFACYKLSKTKFNKIRIREFSKKNRCNK